MICIWGKYICIKCISLNKMGFLVACMVKNLPALQETQVRSLGREDPLEKGMATHSSVLAWRNSWPEEPGGLQSMESQRTQKRLSDFSLIWNTLFNLYINLITRATMRICFHFRKYHTYHRNLLTLLTYFHFQMRRLLIKYVTGWQSGSSFKLKSTLN